MILSIVNLLYIYRLFRLVFINIFSYRGKISFGKEIMPTEQMKIFPYVLF